MSTDDYSPLASAAHWDKLAEEQDRRAAWDSSMGLGDVSAFGHRAAISYSFSGTVIPTKSLRLEHETGVRHCNCHLVPDTKCPARAEARSQ